MNQNMITGMLSSCKMETRVGYRVIHHLVWEDVCLNSKSQEGSSQRVRTYNGRMTRTLVIVQNQQVRRVEEGTATAMFQSGLPDEWWDCAMECHGYLRKVHDKMADGKRAYHNRLGVQFDGLLILFGAKLQTYL